MKSDISAIIATVRPKRRGRLVVDHDLALLAAARPKRRRRPASSAAEQGQAKDKEEAPFHW